MTQRNRRGPLRALLAVCLVLIALILGLRTREAAENACALARRHLPAALGLDVGIGRCAIDPITQTVQLHGVSLFEPGADTPLVAADRAEVSFGAVRPLEGVVELAQVKLLRPRITLDLSKPPREGGENRCSLEPLRRLDIARLEIRDAEVRLVLPGGRAVEVLDGEVSWRRRRGRAEIRVQASRGGLTVRPGVELELASASVDARFDPANERVEITSAELELDGFSLTGAGDISRLCEPELALELSAFLPMQTVARVGGLDDAVDGHLWVRASVNGPAKDPEVGLELAASEVTVGRYAPGTFDARGRLTGEVLRIDQLETQVGQGTLRAKGALTLTERLPLTLSVEADRAELGPALARAGMPGAWVNFPATGRAKAAGPLLPSPQLRGDFELKAGRFVLATQAYDLPHQADAEILTFDGAQLAGAVAVLGDRVELEGIRADSASGRSTVAGNVTLWYAPSKGLLIRGEAPELDFADFGHLAGIHWRGRAGGQFQVAGPYDDVKAVAQVQARDLDFWLFSLGNAQGRIEYAGDTLSFPALSGQKGKLAYTGKADLVFGPGPMRTKGVAYLMGGRLEDLVDALAPMHPNMDHFQDGALTGEVAGVIEVDCPADAFAATVDLQLADTRYFDRGLGDARLVLRFLDGDRAVLDRTVFNGPLGVTEVWGTWHFDGPLDYRFKLDGDLAEVVGAEQAKALELDGKLQLQGRVGGDTDVWTVSAWLTSPRVRFGGRSLGQAHLEARLEGRDLQLWGRPFDGTTTRLELTVREPYPWKLSTQLSLPEVRPLLPEAMAAQGVTGSLGGAVEAKGDLRDGKTLEAVARLDRLTLSRGDFTGHNDGRVDLSYKEGRLAVESFAFRGPNTSLAIGGSAGPRALDLRLHGSADVRLVESFVPWFERSAGRLEVAAATGGTFEAPTLAGTATLTDLRFNVRDQPVAVRGLSGRVEFSERRVVAQNVRGVLNDGRMDLEADLRLEKLQPKDLQVRMLLDEVFFRPVDYLPFTTSGELNLSGHPDDLTLAGNLDILKLKYDQPLVLEDLLNEMRGARPGGGTSSTGEARKEWLTFDLLVKASGDVRVDNNLARARLRGDLRLTGNNLRPGLLGSLEAQEGGELFFRGNTFQVGQAIVEFKDRREIDPVFDLHAQTQVREYLVSLHGFGRVRDPQLILTADPELQEADILSLLAIGVTSRDKSDAVGTALMGAGEALLSASGLDRQVQRFLPKNPLLRDLSFHISSTYNEASGVVEPTAHFETRLLALPLELAMTQPVVTTRGTRARLEYRFDDRLSGQLQWDDDRGENLPNFGLDLKLRWEVE